MLKNKVHIKIILVLFVMTSAGWAQDSTLQSTMKDGHTGQHDFIDADGDGYNDYAPDHDNDGIPNGLDPDFLEMMKKQKAQQAKFIDLDGDGINDFITDEAKEGLIKGKVQAEQNGQGNAMETQKEAAQKQKRTGKR